MTARDDLAWGLVGGLAFLVLLSGYELATGYRAPPAVKFGVAALVFAATVLLSRLVARRLNERA